MRAIARHLAMTASAVHHYFPSRQALLDGMFPRLTMREQIIIRISLRERCALTLAFLRGLQRILATAFYAAGRGFESCRARWSGGCQDLRRRGGEPKRSQSEYGGSHDAGFFKQAVLSHPI